MGHERGLPGTNDAYPDNALCVRRPASGWVEGYVLACPHDCVSVPAAAQALPLDTC